ncbi:hypothetical protein HZU77_014815 [Neisseriaceae bacterium TC5R-5]|nr:hypothetical protein [Neisseriaceae bacterium TC5R-5]
MAGQVLKVPNKVTNIHNNSSTYRPYNPGQAIGDVSPTLPEPPPPPSRGGGGCGFLGTILILAVSVAVVVYTAGTAATMLGATTVSSAVGGSVAASTLGTLGAGMAALGGGLAGGAGLAAAAIGGAVGSIVGQGLSMAMGMQDKFSWSQVATSALGSAVTAGIGQAIGPVNSATTSWQMAGRATAGNTITQGISVATGLQKSFNWTAVAASGVGAGISSQLPQGWSGAPDSLGRMIEGTTRGLVSGGVQSIITGQRPNWGAIAAESFGSSLGDEVVQGIRQREDASQLQRAQAEAEQAEWARQVSGSWQMGGAGNEQDYSRLAWESLQYPTTEIMQTDNKGRIQSGDYWEEKRYQQQLDNQQAMKEGRALVVADQSLPPGVRMATAADIGPQNDKPLVPVYPEMLLSVPSMGRFIAAEGISLASKLTTFVLGGGINYGVQKLSNPDQAANWLDVLLGAGTGYWTSGATFGRTVAFNTYVSGVSSMTQGNNPGPSMLGTAVGSAIGFGVGSVITKRADAVFNPWYRPAWIPTGPYGIVGWNSPNPAPALFGIATGNIVQEYSSSTVLNTAQKKGK